MAQVVTGSLCANGLASRLREFQNGSRRSPEEITRNWKCVKRDGKKVQFDVGKIRSAIERCFQSVDISLDEHSFEIKQIINGVVNSLLLDFDPKLKMVEVTVEDVQRLVIQQIWTAGLFDAAEHYQNYRENRRREREAKPISERFAAAVAEDQQHFPSPLQYYQFLSKFSRWNEVEQRRETWREACTRIMTWFKKQKGVQLRDDEWAMLEDALYTHKATPAMRVVQMAGPALDRCNVGVYNCAYHPIEDLFGFAELLYILMQGSGNGFNVEWDYVGDLPRIRKQTGVMHQHTIEDSTEGWCDALFFGLKCWFDGEDVVFDYSKIRPAGARLLTKGGRASGSDPLRELMQFTRNVIFKRQGYQLTDLDVHDICCKIGKIVQVGGVRRASLISLSDLDSPHMRSAKTGNWYEHAKHRAMANNSAVYKEKPSVADFMEEWVSLIRSHSGERGIFNLEAALAHLPARRKPAKFGCNPCAEIILRPYQFCNLSIAIARPYDTEESLLQKVTVATYFGVMQSTCTNFGYIRPKWKENCEEERLLGVDITGHADCPLLRFGAPGRAALITRLKARVQAVRAELADRFGIAHSAADTTVKPGGDSSVFFDCASGISPRFAAHQVRWVRESRHSPISQFLIDSGVTYAEAPEDASLFVFGFPKQAPEGCTLRNDLTAIQQLENWLEWKQCWAEHSVSATIYVDDHEWFDVGNWVYSHFDHITGLSFLPKDNGSYTYAPNEELTAVQYQEWADKFPVLNWAKLCRYEEQDQTSTAQTYACTSGACELV